MSYVKMLDEVDYMKKEKALARYFRKNYKYLIFEVYPKLKRDYKIDGKYEIILPTCELFERVYGKMKFKFSVQKDVALLEDITPQEILLACYMAYFQKKKRNFLMMN